MWSTICAEGVYTDQGAICCLSPKGQLFVINPNTKSSVVSYVLKFSFS